MLSTLRTAKTLNTRLVLGFLSFSLLTLLAWSIIVISLVPFLFYGQRQNAGNPQVHLDNDEDLVTLSGMYEQLKELGYDLSYAR